MKLSPHNKHIKKLIERGFSDLEIRNDIKKLFGIHFDLSQIQNKRTNELSNLIKHFREDSIELLYPVLYKGFPERNDITDKLDQIINYLLDAVNNLNDFPSENILIDLLLVFESKLNTFKHDAFLYHLIYKYKKQKKQTIEDSLYVVQLKELTINPFKNYFSLSNMNMGHISFKDDSLEFDKIIREVCRDNIITLNEKKYIEEKASEYFIDSEKLKRYLDNPFFGYESFKIFIDQICEDGIITDVERVYIVEKAKQYNVSEAKMEEMINIGLVRSSLLKKLSKYNEFYEIVLIYLVSHSFDIKSTKNIIFEAIQDGRFNKTQNLLSILFLAIEDLKQKLSGKSNYLKGWNNIKQLFEKLNIKFIDNEKALSIYNDYENEQEKLSIEQKKLSFDTVQEKIYIDSLKIEDVEITKSNKLVRPFDVKFLGSKICIEYSDEIDEIILVKALSVFYLKNSKTISKTNLLKQLNRILEQLLNERN
jgi:hypothetical protein